MNSKEIKRQQAFLNCYKTLTDEQKLKLKELSLREMIMSCLTYGNDIFTSICYNSCSEYYNKPYVEEYTDILGYDRVMGIYNDQKNYFDTKCRVEKNVYTDSEGLTYNSLIEEE